MGTEPPCELTLYSRYACPLCEDMQYTLQDFSTDMHFQVTVVDIDNDPQLRALYNEAVPVLVMGDHEVCRHFLDLDALKKAVGTQRSMVR